VRRIRAGIALCPTAPSLMCHAARETMGLTGQMAMCPDDVDRIGQASSIGGKCGGLPYL